MPILAQDELRMLLPKGEITALTVDTNIFDEKQLQFSSATLQTLGRLNGRGFLFMLTSTVCKEVTGHLEEAASQSFRSAKKEIGKALRVFETKEPTREEILDQITGGRTPDQVSQEHFNQYLKDAGCEILDDAELVDTASLFDDYFAARAPFGSGKKKSEFPDALALNALERTATNRAIGILVVSKDGDWENFCRNSRQLFLVEDIERALALVANASPVLRKSVFDWLEDVEGGRLELRSRIDKMVEFMEFDVTAYPSAGECELDVWAGELQDIVWPRENDIDIIEVEPQEGGNGLNLVVSLPLVLDVKIPIDISFFIWDSFDKESIPMGGRTVEVDQQINTEAIITFNIDEHGTETAQVALVDVEIDTREYRIQLGEVDLLDPEDCYLSDEEPGGE